MPFWIYNIKHMFDGVMYINNIHLLYCGHWMLYSNLEG